MCEPLGWGKSVVAKFAYSTQPSCLLPSGRLAKLVIHESHLASPDALLTGQWGTLHHSWSLQLGAILSIQRIEPDEQECVDNGIALLHTA